MSNCRMRDVAFRLRCQLEFNREYVDLPIHAWPEEDIHQDQIVPGMVHFLDSLLSIIDSLDDTSKLLQELARKLPVDHIILHDKDLGRMRPGSDDRGGSSEVSSRQPCFGSLLLEILG